MSEMLMSSYYATFVLWLIASIIGAVTVAALDGQRAEVGRPVPQH